MREKILNIIIILVVLTIGVLGTLYFTNKDTTVQTTSSQKNITIKESDSINSAVNKVYDGVVLVEAFSNSRQTSSGSGFVYKKDSKYGYIMTNYHVVEGATSVKIVNMSGEEVDAEVLGGDSYSDIAVLRIASDKVADVVTVGDSTKAQVGDTVFTVGTPIDSQYMGTVTKGILSSEVKTITVSDQNGGTSMMEVLQTDASINPGNSGGPLANINGEVIGITSMKLVTDEIEGMGFAIPIEIAMASVDSLEKGETIKRPYIGVSMYDVTNEAMLYRNNIRLDEGIDEGVVIGKVEEGSPAAEAKLQANDVIIEVDGTKVKNSAHFKYILYNHKIGETIKLKINRNGKNEEITLKLTQALGDN